MKLTRISIISYCLVLAVLPAYAHRGEGLEKKQKPSGTPNYAADCAPAAKSTRVNFNNVDARVETGGSMWQDRANGNADYFVPAGGESTSIYSGSLWMGGRDLNGQLKIAAVTFRNGTNDFWAGPLSTVTAEIDPATCTKYDNFFTMSRLEVQEFVAWWEAGLADAENGTNTQAENFPDYQIPASIKSWPGNGDRTLDQAHRLAPFFDRDGDENYDPEGAGDYPYYDLNGEVNCRATRSDVPRLIFGDFTHWWVFNDKGNTHTETGGQPIGMEIRAQAFAFATNDAVNDMTFYNYEMINRSSFTLEETYFGQWVDPDLGCSDDDYVGCNVERGLGYCYNGKEVDVSCRGAVGYGSHPPAVGVDFFEGPYQDSDGLNNKRGIDAGEALNGIGYYDERLPEDQRDTTIDNERYGMRRFVYYDRGSGPTNDPVTALDHYNYLRGIWRDGTKLKYGGNGNIASGATALNADFMFPGDSDPLHWGTGGIDPGFAWTEQTANNRPFDRRFLQSAGPFTLTPGAVNDITVGVVWARAVTGPASASINRLIEADDKAQALFDNCFRVLSGPDAPDLTFQELNREIILYLSNPQISNNYREEYRENDPFIVTPQELIDSGIVYDNTYRFQGYQIYQAVDERASVNDIDNPEKMRLAFQCDVKDGIGTLVNFTFSEELNANIATKMVTGADEGIRHSFHVTEDLFAQGDNRLINYKKYYYIAIAYAYNNFKQYDQGDPDLLDGQKRPYLASRKGATGSIKSVAIIPHPTGAEAGGTTVNSKYGDQPEIIRIEGQGNGGQVLDFTAASEEFIVKNYKMDFPRYKAGSGPINVKVIDPLNIPSGQVSLRFIDTTINDNEGTYWVAEMLGTGEQVYSEKPIGFAEEQIILDWGISVSIDQVVHPGVDSEANKDNPFYNAGFITASIEYADSSKQWLTGVPDAEGALNSNWIRAGATKEEVPTDGSNPDADAYNDIFNSRKNPNPDDQEDIYWPRDPNQAYEALFDGGTWMAPHALCAFDIPGVVFHAPAIGRNGNEYEAGGPRVIHARLMALQSVDIVFTPDKTKWTRCPVLETQDDSTLAEGRAIKLGVRASASVDKEGKPDNSGTTGMGWFPGYAINLETGERLNMAFGEDSWLVNENGRDMMWNPTEEFFSGFGSTSTRWGGKHYIYVFRPTNKQDTIFPVNSGNLSNGVTTPMPAYDEGKVLRELLTRYPDEQKYQTTKVLNERDVWQFSCIWVGMPMLASGEQLLSTEARIRLRVEKPYEKYATDTIANGGRPHYIFDLGPLSPSTGNLDVAKEVLKDIKVVPNPYYAYSEYEVTKLDNRVKFTNLPQECTISIYNLSGTLIRRYEKSNSLTELDWDLKNQENIPISSGVYIMHINAPGIGERVIKWLGVLRPIDLESF